ncbi:MAG TPA: hypothetical protein VKA75_12135 [Reyranella sp.]|nr:hypothetical protein [Reyranella sp.]
MIGACADVAPAVAELETRGVACTSTPHLMALFIDPDGHTLALMQEAPKGYTPPA